MRRNYIFIGQKVIQLVINNPSLSKQEKELLSFSLPSPEGRGELARRPLMRGENDSK